MKGMFLLTLQSIEKPLVEHWDIKFKRRMQNLNDDRYYQHKLHLRRTEKN